MPHCAICKKHTAQLANSHIIPKFIYRHLSKKYNEFNQKGILTQTPETNKARITETQYKMKLFCAECESLLSRNETIFAKIFTQINTKSEKTHFTTKSLNKQESDIRYFSASYSIRDLYEIKKREISKLPNLNYCIEELENIILGKSKGNFDVDFTVNNGEYFGFCCTPQPTEKDGTTTLLSLIPGFRIIITFNQQKKLNSTKISDADLNKIYLNRIEEIYLSASIDRASRSKIDALVEISNKNKI